MNLSSRRWMLFATVLLIALATLVPISGAPPRFYWRFESADILVNLLLYLPLGLLLAREGMRSARVAALAFVVSLGIEVLQGTLIPGRRGSPVDVFSNTTGALFGVSCYLGFRRLQRSRSKSSLALALAIALVPVGGWLLSGPLLAPAPPPTTQWHGLWAHHFAETEPFHGKIIAVSFLGRPIPDDRLDSTRTLIEQARRGPLFLAVTLRSASTTEGVTHLASVGDGEGHNVIGVSQLGDDLLLYWVSRGSRLGFRSPQFHLAGGAQARSGERLRIDAWVTHSRASTTIQGDSGARSHSWRLTPFTGWRNLIPTRDLSPLAQRLFDVVWTLGLAGYLLFAVRIIRQFYLIASAKRESLRGP